MNVFEIIIVCLLAAAVLWAAIHTARKMRHGGGCCGECMAAEKKLPVRDRNKSHYPYTVQMKIEGMTCERCARRIENALNSLDGVWARVDIGSHTARVLLKNPPDEAKLTQAVIAAGYTVSETGD